MIKFSSVSGQTVSMFEKEAIALLRAMKMSGAVPGAIASDDIPAAIANLQHMLNTETDQPTQSDDAGDDAVSAKTRAFPLIELMKQALENEESVMWENQ